jgi:hypothetical protein
MNEFTDNSKFLGTWKLLKHGYYLDNKYHSTSEYLDGRLIYNSDFGMSVLIVKKITP